MKKIYNTVSERTYFVNNDVIYKIYNALDSSDKVHSFIVKADRDIDGDGVNDDNILIDKIKVFVNGKSFYYFLDNLIEVGDLFKESAFTKVIHESDGESAKTDCNGNVIIDDKSESTGTLFEYYKLLCNDTIKKVIANYPDISYVDLFDIKEIREIGFMIKEYTEANGIVTTFISLGEERDGELIDLSNEVFDKLKRDVVFEIAMNAANDAVKPYGYFTNGFYCKCNDSLKDEELIRVLNEDIAPGQCTEEYVEIDGIKWATMNVGATGVTDYGLYFQWGDIQGYTADQVGDGDGKKPFAFSDYKYSDGTSTGFTKYNTTDRKTVLDPDDDVVNVEHGGNWRMPTFDEYKSLVSATTPAWTTSYKDSGVAGVILTSKDDTSKEIFLPAGGVVNDKNTFHIGDRGYYWTNSIRVEDDKFDEAHNLYFLIDQDGNPTIDIDDRHRGCSRYIGQAIRGIIE